MRPRAREQERAKVLAQRFRVYQYRGYYPPGLGADRDVYELLGSARLIFGESRAAFRFPAEQLFELDLPRVVGDTAIAHRTEVSRVVAEAVHGIVIGGLLTPLGLMQAIGEYARPHGARSGLAVIKQRLLRALQDAGVALHEIQLACVIYPKGGSLSATSTARIRPCRCTGSPTRLARPSSRRLRGIKVLAVERGASALGVGVPRCSEAKSPAGRP